MQEQADASCVKRLGAGWVAEGVDDKMPYGASCRPVSDCAKATDLYDKCKIDYDALAKQYGAVPQANEDPYASIAIPLNKIPPTGNPATVPIPKGAIIGPPVPPPPGFVPETKTPVGDKECQAYWQPILDKVCKR
jgi:hypothetical protein